MSTPPTRPVLRERYERRQRVVVDAAAVLFAEQGFQGTSVADLVEATGLTAGGLYHYMGSKDQLLIQICDELMDPLLAATLDILQDEKHPVDQLRARLLLPQNFIGNTLQAGAAITCAKRISRFTSIS